MSLLVRHLYTEQSDVCFVSSTDGMLVKKTPQQVKISLPYAITSECSNKNKVMVENSVVISTHYLGHIDVLTHSKYTELYIEGGIRDGGQRIPLFVLRTDVYRRTSVISMNTEYITVQRG